LLKFKHIIVWLCIFYLGKTMHSQAFYKEYQQLSSQKQVTTIPKIVDSLIQKSIMAGDLNDAGWISTDFSLALYQEGNYQEAITYGIRAVEIWEQAKIFDSTYCRILNRLAVYYYRNKDYEKSILIHNKIIRLNIDENFVARSYTDIGRNYNQLLDFHKALSYHNEGIARLEKQKDYETLKGRYINLSTLYNTINTRESNIKNIEILKKLEVLQDQIAFTVEELYAFNNAYAANYSTQNLFDFDKADLYYKKNLEIALKNQDSFKINTSYFNLGNIYNTIKDAKALSYIQKGITYAQNKDDEVIGLHLLSDYYKNQEKLNEALEYIDASILINAPRIKFEPKTIQKNKLDLIESLVAKVSILLELYEQQKDLNVARKALETIIITDELIDSLQNESFETASLFHWRVTASELYAQGVFCSKVLNEKTQAFYFMEKNKALLLTQAILKNTQRDKVPVAITQQETVLTKRIFELENQLVKNVTKEERKDLESQLFSEKQKRAYFLDSIKTYYPNYFAATNSAAIYPLKSVQEQLQEDELILSYIWNETVDISHSFYGLLITKNDIELFEIQEQEHIKKLVGDYQLGLSKPFDTNTDRKQFQEVAYKLYASLFPTQRIRDVIKNKKLLIVPDNILQTIPFEALIIDPKTTDYLIEHTTISYAYSMSSLFHNKTTRREPEKNFIGFAPTVFKDNILDSLPQTVSELNTIQSITEGNTYIRKEALKNTFLEEASNYSIIHLATHADATQSPWVAFYDEKLNLNELYTFYNKAELVVLSGCNTTLGTVASGEGVLSLARGFFYSGTNTVVSSLWNTNDKSTSHLFQQFYKNLDRGQSKSEALRNSKLEYLKDQAGSSQASPYYWASFILIGDSDKLPKSDSTILTITVISLLLLLLIGVFFRLRTQQLSRKAKISSLHG